MSTATNSLDNFRQAIEQAGLHPPNSIIPDGTLHRFASNGERDDDSGWYVLFPDGLPAGSFGCWRAGLTQKWCAKADRQLTEPERVDYRQRIEAAQRQREAAERQRQAETAALAQQLWAHAPPASASHPYLQRKKVQPHGLKLARENENVLLIPVTINESITSLQLIDQDGDKQFLPGGKVKGGSFLLGELNRSSTIMLCEGFATGASVHEATGAPMIVAFNAGNLLAVAKQLRHQFPTAAIVLAGDNDVHDDGKPNAGLLAAHAAAAAIGGLVAIPAVINNTKTDWNDVHVQCGLNAVREAIEGAMRAVPPEGSDETPAALPNEPKEETATHVHHDQSSTDSEPGLTKCLADAILQTEHFAQDAGGQL